MRSCMLTHVHGMLCVHLSVRSFAFCITSYLTSACMFLQFYITVRDEITSLDEKRTVFGQVSEGLDVLEKISEAFVDDDSRPLQNIR